MEYPFTVISSGGLSLLLKPEAIVNQWKTAGRRPFSFPGQKKTPAGTPGVGNHLS
jgi:hypothetical protein